MATGKVKISEGKRGGFLVSFTDSGGQKAVSRVMIESICLGGLCEPICLRPDIGST
jgi:hypothetical protein